MPFKLGLVTDSTSDLPDFLVEQYGLEVVPSILILEGKEFADGRGISRQEFYKQLPFLGTGVSTTAPSIGDLAKTIRLLTNSSSEIVLIPYAEAYEAGFEDMQRRIPDVSRLGDFLGYRPSMPLAEMLKRIVEDMRS